MLGLWLHNVMVLIGSLPSGTVLQNLPALRQLDVHMHNISGTLFKPVQTSQQGCHRI
jgi:hypothetical protein